MEAFLFYFCGGLMVLASILLVASRSAVVGALWLIFAFLNAAGIYALLNASFLAVLQVLVYAGAIMVLFIFVIMMLQSPVLPSEGRRSRPWLWPLIMVPPLAIALGGASWLRQTGTVSFDAAAPEGFGTPAAVAALLLDRYLLAFELISIVLLVAIIGALAIGKAERRQAWK